MLTAKPRADTDSHKWLRYSGRDVIPAWVADTDFAAAEPIVAALQERVAHGVFGYSVEKDSLRPIVCDYFSRRWQWQIDPSWLLMSPGLGCAIHNVCRMAAGGEILTPLPIYHVFLNAPKIAGAECVGVPMRYNAEGDEWFLDLPALEEKTTKQTRVLQLCNPHNPNGKVFTRAELEAIGEFCCRHDLIICADEVHADIILDEGVAHIPIASIADDIARRTITLQSPSKAFNIAGLNFAVAVISDETLRQSYQQHAAGKVISHLNPFAYAAAQAAWSGQCDEWLTAMTAQLRANRDRLQTAIDEMPGITMPHLAATYLAWLNISTLALENPPAHFEHHGLGLSPGSQFGDPNYIRLNFGCPPETIEKILTRLHSAIMPPQ